MSSSPFTYDTTPTRDSQPDPPARKRPRTTAALSPSPLSLASGSSGVPSVSQSTSPSYYRSGRMMSPSEVRCRHILIKHSGSRNPSSWKSDRITRSKEQALEIVASLREQIILNNASFQHIASTESDCSSARNGGDLGRFGRGQMQKPFEDVAFSLDVGEISGFVQTDSGIHIIQRLE